MKNKIKSVFFRLLFIVVGLILCIAGFIISVKFIKTLSGDIAGTIMMAVGAYSIFVGISNYLGI